MARRTGPRGLRPDEKELWQQIKKTARPLRNEGVTRLVLPEHAPSRNSTPQVEKAPVDVGGLVIRPRGTARDDIAPTLAEQMAGQPIAMDRKAYQKMRRGKLAIEARLDLHGLTLAEAHPRLISFILNARAEGKRLVLVITGKGRRGDDRGPIPVRQGALRHQVPQWLRAGPLAGAVLQIAPAHRGHGGEGAYYVYLRRGG